MKPELFRSRAGSEVRVTGKHGGIYKITFDWLEEGILDFYEAVQFDPAAPAIEVHYGDGERPPDIIPVFKLEKGQGE